MLYFYSCKPCLLLEERGLWSSIWVRKVIKYFCFSTQDIIWYLNVSNIMTWYVEYTTIIQNQWFKSSHQLKHGNRFEVKLYQSRYKHGKQAHLKKCTTSLVSQKCKLKSWWTISLNQLKWLENKIKGRYLVQHLKCYLDTCIPFWNIWFWLSPPTQYGFLLTCTR